MSAVERLVSLLPPEFTLGCVLCVMSVVSTVRFVRLWQKVVRKGKGETPQAARYYKSSAIFNGLCTVVGFMAAIYSTVDVVGSKISCSIVSATFSPIYGIMILSHYSMLFVKASWVHNHPAPASRKDSVQSSQRMSTMIRTAVGVPDHTNGLLYMWMTFIVLLIALHVQLFIYVYRAHDYKGCNLHFPPNLLIVGLVVHNLIGLGSMIVIWKSLRNSGLKKSQVLFFSMRTIVSTSIAFLSTTVAGSLVLRSIWTKGSLESIGLVGIQGVDCFIINLCANHCWGPNPKFISPSVENDRSVPELLKEYYSSREEKMQNELLKFLP